MEVFREHLVQTCTHSTFVFRGSKLSNSVLVCQKCKAKIQLQSQEAQELLKRGRKAVSAEAQTEQLRRQMIEDYKPFSGLDPEARDALFLKKYGVSAINSETGDREIRFSYCDAESADAFKRWLARQEPQSEPRIETNWQKTAVVELEKWMDSQPPEAVRKFAIRTWIELLDQLRLKHEAEV